MDNGYSSQQMRALKPATRTEQDQQQTRLKRIHALHPDNMRPTQKNAGKTQHQQCWSTFFFLLLWLYNSLCRVLAVSVYHQGKSTAIFHLSRKLWD